MPYSKSPMKKSSCIKMYDSKGKQSGLMMEGSVAHMESMANYGSPYKLDDPDPKKDGVVVTGKDKSKSAEQARLERVAKRKQEIADAKMKKEIALANKREELKFKLEERKAAAAAKRQRAQQKLKERQGRIPQGAEDTSTSYSPFNQNTGGGKPTTMDFNVGTGLVEKEGDRRKQFEKAFATARKAGVETFTYNVGEEPKKKYTTKLKGKK